MCKVHLVQSVWADDTYLCLTVDGQAYRIGWEGRSPRLANATPAQQRHFEISPSGYGTY